ncbi:hypothetical protein B0H14DRAFT_3669536 [Mycena olivaceomarginata]|nr:hypothetical protein B0H14DRAFT_3669536 [Mycena olivaceomarginata]
MPREVNAVFIQRRPPGILASHRGGLKPPNHDGFTKVRGTVDCYVDTGFWRHGPADPRAIWHQNDLCGSQRWLCVREQTSNPKDGKLVATLPDIVSGYAMSSVGTLPKLILLSSCFSPTLYILNNSTAPASRFGFVSMSDTRKVLASSPEFPIGVPAAWGTNGEAHHDV